MLQVEDTQLTDVNYKPGTLPDGGKWRVEFDTVGRADTALPDSLLDWQRSHAD
jgi:hypothetical protein